MSDEPVDLTPPGDAPVTAQPDAPQPADPDAVVRKLRLFSSRKWDESHPEAPYGSVPVQPPAPPQAVKPNKHELQHRREQRRATAYQMWLRNVPLREIGQHLGVTGKTAWYDIEAYRLTLKGPREKTLGRTRDQLLAQHEANQRSLWTIADSAKAPANVMARSEITKSLAEMAKLTGAYMPVKVASTTPDGKQWAPLAVTVLQQLSDEELLTGYKLQRMKLLPVLDGEKVG